MFKSLCLLFLIGCLSIRVQATVDLMSCSQKIGENLLVNIGGGDASGSLFPFKIEGTKILPLYPTRILIQESTNTRQFYKYKVPLGFSETRDKFATRTLEVVRDSQGNITLTTLYDKDALLNAAKDLSPNSSALLFGSELTFSGKSEECELTQRALFWTKIDKNLPAEVVWDKKYCDQILKITEDARKVSSEPIGDIFLKVQKVYNSRSEELSKENKTFGKFGAGIIGPSQMVSMCYPTSPQLDGLGMGPGTLKEPRKQPTGQN